MQFPPVRFAICGVGHIGRRHAALVSRHAGAALAALIDPRADLQPGLAAEFPGVLTVATPNGLHAPQAVAGLNVLHLFTMSELGFSIDV